MMGRLTATTAWMLGWAALFGAAFWTFLNTPESTVFTLALSLLLIGVMYVVLALAWSGALLGWSQGLSGGTARRAFGGIAAFLPPALLVVVAWWLVGRGLDWLANHSGQISAWFIASFNWSDVRPLLRGVTWFGEWVRQLVVPFAGLVWLDSLLRRGWRPLFDRACLSHALSPLRLLLATLIAGVTIFVPLHYGVYWMPQGLPATWLEPAFAIVKFGVMALVGAVGASLIARLAAGKSPQ